jgi:guanosine-3',5'-bis(diphosphate) 3'-pyrophosphohydrolase
MQDHNEWWTVLDHCKYSNRLLGKLALLNEARSEDDRIDISQVQKAIYYAKKYHGNQKRQSGEPYYTHPLEVAYMISDYLFRTDIIVTSILHDTIEDTALTFGMIKQLFGEVIARQVMDLTRIKGDDGRKISSAETVRVLFEQKKYDVLLIKQFDRLHNMQTIGAKSQESMKRIIEETIGSFIVLAAFLGIRIIEEELIQACANLTSNEHGDDQCNDLLSKNDAHLLSLMFQNDEAHK